MREAAQKGIPTQNDDRRNQPYRQSRHRCCTGRARRAREGPRQEGCQPEERRAQGQESRQRCQAGSQRQGAPKKAAKAGAKTSKKAAKSARKAAAPRAESKGAKILEMIARAKGATLAEIMKVTDWQAHNVRGFISTAAKKHGVKIESAKNDAGERTYRIGK
jgi:hypothetical protein